MRRKWKVRLCASVDRLIDHEYPLPICLREESSIWRSRICGAGCPTGSHPPDNASLCIAGRKTEGAGTGSKGSKTERDQCRLRRLSVLDAPHRKAARLRTGVPIDRGIAGIQIPKPRSRPTLRRRPEVGVRATIDERAVRVAVAG